MFKGIRHTVYDQKGEFLLQPDFQRGIGELVKFNLTYDLLVYAYQLPGAVELARKFPNQSFVLNHIGKPQIPKGPLKEWIFHIHELAKFPNVFCKLSGLVSETGNFTWEHKDIIPFLDVVLDAFGLKRLMFGSDWPVCSNSASYKGVLGLVENYFSEESKNAAEKVFGGNAVRFYRL